MLLPTLYFIKLDARNSELRDKKLHSTINFYEFDISTLLEQLSQLTPYT